MNDDEHPDWLPYHPRLKHNFVVEVSATAPAHLNPGTQGWLVSWLVANNESSCEKYGVDIGTFVCTVEKIDGFDIVVPEPYLIYPDDESVVSVK